MAESTRSVLLVDRDSMQRSLAAVGDEAAGRFVEHCAAWLAAIETGELLDGEPRTLTVKRCYAGPAGRGAASAPFVAAGFDMVPCPPPEGDSRGLVDLHLTIDAMDALSDPADSEEFILLTATHDLEPLLARLKGHERRTAIYIDDATATDYRAAADSVVTAEAFAEFLAGVGPSAARAVAAGAPVDRNRIEAFAREVHAATNIPMFSPKTFGELFRSLAEEIAASGYHFQETAKKVADRLSASGRSVTGRQVVFVVKGLALKGHVFSTNDSPERLAEVFREQARYLIGNSGIVLDDEREKLLAAWIAAPPAPKPVAAPKAQPQKAGPLQKPAQPYTAARQAKKPPERKPAPARPQAPAAAARPQAPAAPAKPAAPPPRIPERPKSAAVPPPKPSEPEPPPAPKASASADMKAAIAARIAASARMKPPARPVAMLSKSPPPKPPEPPPPKPSALENSILAAIAEAVDVLVEDGGGKAPPASEPSAPAGQAEPVDTDTDTDAAEPAPPPQPVAALAPPAEPEPEPEPEPDPPEDGGDIGDEIQRIVATYNRNRTENEQR